MSRYLVFIIIAVLVNDYVWSFNYWVENNTRPESWMVVLNTIGLFMLLPFALLKPPNKFVVKCALAWSAIYVVLNVINFQQFNAVIKNEAATLVFSVILYCCLVSPVFIYWRKLSEHKNV